jgi:glycosyltransferase involved in cell wall biosynthesis
MILNDAMVDEAVEAGFSREKLLWMPNPVDMELYQPCRGDQKLALRAQLGIDREAEVAIFVGRLAPEKELPSLIAGFALTARERPLARLVLVGDGPMRQSLQAQVSDLGIAGRVLFAGMRPPDEIRRWLQAADVFLLVSRREGLPVSLIEAMAIHLPAVVTRIPANTQLVADGEQGLHVEINDPEAIGGALIRLFGDPEMRHRFGLAARSVAERFSLDKVLAAYEDMFAEILAGRHQ